MFLNNISIYYKLAFVKSIWNEQNFYNYDFYVQNWKLWQVHSIPYTRDQILSLSYKLTLNDNDNNNNNNNNKGFHD